jgi:hypothetical protein
VVGGARRQSDQQLNLDLPGVETHMPLPITHSEDYYQYLRHTDHHVGHSQSKKAHVASTRQRLDSRQGNHFKQAQSVMGAQIMHYDMNEEEQMGRDRFAQTAVFYPGHVRAQSTLVQDLTISSNPLGSLDTGFNDAFGR